MKQNTTSWSKVSGWYDNEVKAGGHYYHEAVLLPRVLDLILSTKCHSLVDLGCGQGVLERSISKTIKYTGIDISRELVETAKRRSTRNQSTFFSADLTKPISLPVGKFECAISMLALQNMENYQGFFDNLEQVVLPHGYAIIVLNHPYYRIPRMSGWDISKGNSKQVRWVSNYLEEQKIPIVMNPSKKNRGARKVTWSFHVPLSRYIQELSKRGFLLANMIELASDKESEGRFATRENTARNEIPLFMILVARKV